MTSKPSKEPETITTSYAGYKQIIADRDRYKEALEEIAEILPMVGCLDGPEACNVARKALGLPDA